MVMTTAAAPRARAPMARRLVLALAMGCACAPGVGGVSRAAASSRVAASRASASAVSMGPRAPARPDPYELVRDDIKEMKARLREVAKLSAGPNAKGAAASQPVLTMAVQEFLKRPGKSFRPMLVLLLGRAASATRSPPCEMDEEVRTKHMRLAELTEMMNIASIIHDDVVNDAASEGGGGAGASAEGDHAAAAAAAAHGMETGGGGGGEAQPAGNIVHQMYSANVGNKVSILAGDFLLARAAVQLAQLQDPVVVEVMAGALEAIVQGGMLRSEAMSASQRTLEAYCARTQARSAQLISNSCRCAALLAGFSVQSAEAAAAEAFGLHLGMAHQMALDLKAFNASLAAVKGGEHAAAGVSGGGGGAQGSGVQPLGAGVPSAALLLALERRPALEPILMRNAGLPGDVEKAVSLVRECGAVESTVSLVESHVQSAVSALHAFEDCDARAALLNLCNEIGV